MSLLSLMEVKLPPGFRFHPKDEELVCHYLANKVAAAPGSVTPMMIEVDLNKIEPWDLPDAARVGERQWYFYSLRDRKYATGLRTNRATMSGYWKATGKDRQVVDRRRGIVVGMRKTLVFYRGRAPRGKNTEWVMHEFRLEGSFGPAPKPTFKEDWVLCRVVHKNKCDFPSKQCQYENSYDDTGASSSPPPLSDNLLSFDQNPLSLEVFDEQVPCFSNFAQTNSSPALQDFSQAETNVPIWEMVHTKALPDLADFLNPISCEKNVIMAVLDQLTKMDGNQKSLDLAIRYGLAAGSCESYFPEMGMPTISPQFLLCEMCSHDDQYELSH